MDVVSLADLAPILAAVLGPMLAFSVAIMRYLHIDNAKTRDLIEKSSKENRDLIEKSSKDNRDLIEKHRKETGDSLAEVRERLARIEGRILHPPPHDDEAEAA